MQRDMNDSAGVTPPPRTLSIQEAAEATGLGRDAIRSRVDRGTLRVVKHRGVRRIPLSELERAGLIRPRGQAAAATDAVAAGVAAAGPVLDVEALLDRLERQAQQLAEVRLLTAQAGEREAAERAAREALEAEVHQVRAEAQQARAQDRPPGPDPERGAGRGG